MARRRDRRAERIARNRRHPQHSAVAAASAPARGPTGRPRRDPHRRGGAIGPAGRLRLDRAAPAGEPPQSTGQSPRPAAEPAAPQRLEQPSCYIVVVPDLPGGRPGDHDRDVLGQARQLAGADGAVVVVAFGAGRDADLGATGADRVASFELAGYDPEGELAALLAVERDLAPRHWLFPDSPGGGRDRGARLAARLGERPATGVWKVEDSALMRRGGDPNTDWHGPLRRLLLLAAECARPVSGPRREARPLAIELEPPERRCIRDGGAVPVDPARVALAEAEFILAGGNGVRDWTFFHHAAEVLGASEGASRVAVDDGHMPRERQVGATGTAVTARVYLAVGISGAIQHLQGIERCETVIAINADDRCDMIARADLSLIGDAGEILAELVALVDEHRGREEDRHVA